MALLGLYCLLVIALLLAELKQVRRAQMIFKPAAAFGFVLLALQQGALETDFGILIFIGLVACALGDVFLLSRHSQAMFKSGMAAFAIGHVFFIFAANHISNPNITLFYWGGSLLFGVLLAYIVFRYLKPRLPKDLVWPVGFYTLIISAMIIYALQSDFLGPHIYIVPAALLFAISDLFVARDRFIRPSPNNAILITPLYFTAQALFALSVTV